MTEHTGIEQLTKNWFRVHSYLAFRRLAESLCGANNKAAIQGSPINFPAIVKITKERQYNYHPASRRPASMLNLGFREVKNSWYKYYAKEMSEQEMEIKLEKKKR